ncbi:guanylate kinase-like protein [Leishmania major strain Friedlin]|uniref:Guanylate kinase-like protein n=1 Tax=Leishmania major TaxID=5664 RepID=Q4Q1J5_LEIMA|nr:guanylate kinase-like protein [Leishmania major strain Friedlin]CAG9583755.1 guanylate_kinase-like_protein [Leishmania major strain Friedlin]CAJ09184.1 guanylate kinase-like protein [Leishmania major strain Friedlin]|eukprot:XP_001686803.1 guanylate kinase-like protein [Leishmania major strain Friedlin]
MSVAPKAPMPAISSVAAASAARKASQQAVGPLKGTVALRRLVDVLLFVGPSGCGKSTVIRRLQRDWPTLFEFSVSHTTRCPRPGEVHGQHYYFVTMEEFQQLVDAGHMIEYSRLCMPETSSSTPPLSKPVGNLYGTSKKALNTVLACNRVVLMDTDLLGAINIRRYCSREVASTSPVTVSRAQRSIVQHDGGAAPAAQAPLTLSTPRHVAVSVENEHAAVLMSAYSSKDSILSSSPSCAAPAVTRTLRCMIIFIAPPSMQVLEQRLRERKTETEASIQLRMTLNRQWMQWARENQSFFDHYIVNDHLDLCYAKVKEIVRAEVLMVESTL